MPKEWDHLMKWLAHANPQHLVSLLMKDALFESEAINELQVQSREIQADILYNILWKRQRAILHAEFQRRRDADIGRRVWEYNALTECLKQVPVYSFVIYLVKDSGIVQPPYRRVLPDGSISHVFYYTNVYLWELPASAFKGPGREGLLPLLPLTKNGARREVIEEMIEELQAAHKQDLLALAYSFAALVLQKKEDRQWLKRRFEMLSDILEDSWAFQELKERAEKRAIEKAREEVRQEVRQEVREEVREEVRQEVREEARREARQEAEREVKQRVEQARREVERELSQKMEQEVEQLKRELVQQLARQMEREVARMQEEEARKALQQGRLVQERETLEQYVQAHFPALLPLLQERAESIQNLGTLRQLLFHLLEARGEDEARSLILTANDQAE